MPAVLAKNAQNLQNFSWVDSFQTTEDTEYRFSWLLEFRVWSFIALGLKLHFLTAKICEMREVDMAGDGRV